MWYLELHLGIKIFTMLEQQHQCVVTVPKWQNINCQNRKYKVWIYDEEMFFIPFLLVTQACVCPLGDQNLFLFFCCYP